MPVAPKNYKSKKGTGAKGSCNHKSAKDVKKVAPKKGGKGKK
jgi:hypothetical protein